MLKVTPENVISVLKEQISETKRNLDKSGYDPNFVRNQVTALAQQYGSPALDVGTGACANMAEIMAQSGLFVTAIDHAPNAVNIAKERVAGNYKSHLEIRQAEATSLPFPNHSYRVVVAFDAVCHADHPAQVISEMFRVCDHQGAVIITELNDAGRRITNHPKSRFESGVTDLLTPHCRDCRHLESTHHLTIVCERN